MKTRHYCTTLGALAALVTTSAVLADTHVENPDAGITEATAQVLSHSINQITGTLKPGTTDSFGVDPVDVDTFCFTLDHPVNGAVITVISPNGDFDPNLLLLRAGFYGIAGDDDSGGGISNLDSQITVDLSPGTYYIAVGENNVGAFASGAADANDYAWDDDFGILIPAQAAIPIVFVGTELMFDATIGQSYTVRFNFETSDDPATAAIRKSLEKKVKKLEKKIRKAKQENDLSLVNKLKKKLKKLEKKIKRL